MWNSLTRYHPRIGYTFMPSVKSRVLSENGGYLVRTNAAGFRSDREFVQVRAPGKFRAILFGDSQTAGDGNSNGERYSDVVERIVPDLEVFNYALPGTGPDQHYLTYLDCADVEYDLIVIAIHVDNIDRVVQRFRPYIDDRGEEVVYAKPYYTIERGELVLRHVPVPKAPLSRSSISSRDAEHVNAPGAPHRNSYYELSFGGVYTIRISHYGSIWLRTVIRKLGLRYVLQGIIGSQPAPDYNSPTNPNWLLLRKILETWICGSKSPVLLFLVPMWAFIEKSSDPTNYQARFHEIALDTGCYLHDPLPDLWKYTDEERRAFRLPDSHFSPKGHRALALSLAAAIEDIRRRAKGC